MADMNVFRPADVAARWKCSIAHVHSLIRDGKLHAFRLGGRLIRIPLDAVEEFECRSLNSEPPSTEDIITSCGVKVEPPSGKHFGLKIVKLPNEN